MSAGIPFKYCATFAGIPSTVSQASGQGVDFRLLDRQRFASERGDLALALQNSLKTPNIDQLALIIACPYLHDEYAV
jgi:hypothetical protein